MNAQAKSRGAWGRRQERTIAELEKLCGDAFKALQIPKHWKFENYDRCRLTEDETSEIQTIGAWFLDTNTKGIDIKRYRLYFHSYSERLGLVEKSVVEYGKYKQELLVQNKTPENMNDFIRQLQLDYQSIKNNLDNNNNEIDNNISKSFLQSAD